METEGKIAVGGAVASLARFPAQGGKRALGAGRTFVGLTGGIGAGKSSFTDGLAAAGAVVFSADELARVVVAPGTPGLASVVEVFGDGVLAPDGSLDRAALGALVFADKEARRDLERITHPLIAAEARRLALEAPPGSVVVYEVPLLVEKQMQDQFDVVVVVDAPLSRRIARLEQRGLSPEDAGARIAAQATRSQREQAANVWVLNGGTVSELEDLAAAVLAAWIRPALSWNCPST